MAKLTEFPRFKDLPGELRELIWKTALPDSRIIILEHKRRKLDRDHDSVGRPFGRIDMLGFRADATPPSILFVCHEAYKVASRSYKRAFSNKPGSSIPEVWLNFKIDFLYLGPEYLGPKYIGPGPSGSCHQERVIFILQSELHPDDLSRIENLAIWWDSSVHGFNGPWTAEKYLADVLSHFGNVKHVTFVCKMYALHGLWADTTPKKHAHLKFLDAQVDSPFIVDDGFATDPPQDFQLNIKVQGFEIPNSNTWLSVKQLDMTTLKALSVVSGGKADSPKAWKIPRIDYDVITTPCGEELLLQEAQEAPSKAGDTS
ncbi:uncharacterized protein PAC_17391 [Phialocephala subalpina]|uniref:2EXR domain-containing protein n=1 Tax=Phialocephala subalpina TaxID=576137 RepID=A0A1L7XR05_9HELO|nr:uncharacterized protein PAC_17391 [Phialocephala subalpina]